MEYFLLQPVTTEVVFSHREVGTVFDVNTTKTTTRKQTQPGTSRRTKHARADGKNVERDSGVIAHEGKGERTRGPQPTISVTHARKKCVSRAIICTSTMAVTIDAELCPQLLNRQAERVERDETREA